MNSINNMKKEGGAGVNLLGNRCYRCSHEWLSSDKEHTPKVCPSCKTPYWDTPKTRFTKADKEKKK